MIQGKPTYEELEKRVLELEKIACPDKTPSLDTTHLNQEMFRAMTNSGMALIWTAGADRLCNYFNDPWLKFTGRTLEQEMGNGWAEGVHPDDFDACLKTYFDAFDRREPFEMEYRLRHASGEYRWLLDMGSPNYSSTGEFIGYIGHCFDINDRKRLEHQLSERMKELQAFYRLAELTEKEGITPEILFRKLISVLPESWQYPEIACGRIIVDGTEYRTENFRDSAWKLSAPITVSRSVVGTIEIAYLQEKPVEYEGPFFKEERMLLDAIAERLGRITERQRVSKALRISEGRFRNYFELPLIGRAITSPGKGWLDVNETLCNMLGYAKDELIRMTWAELTHPEDITPDFALFNEVMAGGINGYSINKRFIRKDGQIVNTHMAVQCLRNPDGSVDSFVGIILDISDLKKTEELLRQSEEKYRLISESTSDVIWKMNVETLSYTYISPSVIHLTGFTVEEAMQQSIQESLSPESAAVVLAELPLRIRKFYSGDTLHASVVFELQQLCKNGTYIWVEISATFIVDMEGKIAEIIGVSRNIDRRKNSDLLIQEQNLRLKELVAEKDKFFSIIAHDLRAPFNTFLGFTRMMVEDLPSLRLDEIQNIALYMRNSATSLYSLLENLLDWSRLEREMTGYDPAPLNLKALVDESIQTVTGSAKVKGLTLNLDIPPELTVCADGYMIGSTVRNLATNALKFTPKGGKVTISANPVDENFVEVSIRDTGIGMNESLLGKLFQVQENISRKGTDGEPSTGLGLIICKDFVEKNGGTIRVESEEGIGTVFYFTLPVNPKTEA